MQKKKKKCKKKKNQKKFSFLEIISSQFATSNCHY